MGGCGLDLSGKDRDTRRSIVNTVVKCQVPSNCGNDLTSLGILDAE
jgi:hypothetical protein